MVGFLPNQLTSLLRLMSLFSCRPEATQDTASCCSHHSLLLSLCAACPLDGDVPLNIPLSQEPWVPSPGSTVALQSFPLTYLSGPKDTPRTQEGEPGGCWSLWHGWPSRGGRHPERLQDSLAQGGPSLETHWMSMSCIFTSCVLWAFTTKYAERMGRTTRQRGFHARFRALQSFPQSPGGKCQGPDYLGSRALLPLPTYLSFLLSFICFPDLKKDVWRSSVLKIISQRINCAKQ